MTWTLDIGMQYLHRARIAKLKHCCAFQQSTLVTHVPRPYGKVLFPLPALMTLLWLNLAEVCSGEPCAKVLYHTKKLSA